MRVEPLDFEIHWRRAHPFPWGRNGRVNPFVCHFGTSSHTTTETQKNDPWAPQQPYLTQGFGLAQNLVNSPLPQQQNPVAPFNGAQDSALNSIISRAMGGTPIANSATGFANDLESGDYLNANPANGFFSSLAGNNIGLNNPGASVLQGIAGSNPANNLPGNATLGYFANNNVGSGGPGAGTLARLSSRNLGVANGGTPALQDYANGSYFSNGYSDDTAQNVMSQVVPQIASIFNRGNNVNNPALARAAASGVTSALAPLEYQNYQTQEQLQQQAAQNIASNTITGANSQGTFAKMLSDLGLSGANISADAAKSLNTGSLTGTGQQIGAASTLSGGAVSGAGVQAQGATGLANNWQDTLAKMVQGNALAPQNQALSFADMQQLFNAGSAQQTQAQNEASGNAASYNFSQMAPYQQLAAYMGAVTGNMGNTQTTTKPYYTNDTANTLGTMSSLGSLAALAFL